MLMKGSRFTWGTMAVATFVSVLGCSSDGLTGPEGNLTDQDKAAIVQALSTTGGLAGAPAAAFAPFFIDGITGLGQMTSTAAAARIENAVNAGLNLALSSGAAEAYEGFGVMVGYDITQGNTTSTGWMAGVIGFNNLDVSANTVDNLVTAFVLGTDSTTPPVTAAGVFEDGSAFGTYYGSSTSYFGTTGTVAITASGFSGNATSCDGSLQGISVTCTVSVGSMAGNFAFDASTAGGGLTFTQVPIGFQNLPAVMVQISVTASN